MAKPAIFISAFLLFVVAAITFSCGGSPNVRENERLELARSRSGVSPEPGVVKIVLPEQLSRYKYGSDISVKFELSDDSSSVKEIDIVNSGRKIDYSGSFPELTINTEGLTVGSNEFRFTLVLDDEKIERLSLNTIILSDIEPQLYSFRIVDNFVHDTRAFTQGLLFDKGYLYESTGIYGESSLRKVNLVTGEIVQSIKLDRSFFGEGLALFDGKLYQLTWKSNVGFIYDKESFRLLGRFHYQGEGWGLTTDGVSLIRSDGSHTLFFHDPNHFTPVSELEVWDNSDMVRGLNEMEFHDGVIYANVFPTDMIARIDAATGRVLAYIDLTNILDKRYHHPDIDVLNGIAYDSEADRFMVTGKNWPRVFEVEFLKR